MNEHIRQRFTRSLIALGELAGTLTDSRLRTDITDEMTMGIATATNADRGSDALRAWCASVLGVVAAVPEQSEAVAYARLSLLRLQALLPVPPRLHEHKTVTPKTEEPAPFPSVKLPPAASAVLDVVREHPGVHTAQVMELVGGQMSSRTVKRALKELAGSGLIQRLTSGKGVAYMPQLLDSKN